MNKDRNTNTDDATRQRKASRKLQPSTCRKRKLRRGRICLAILALFIVLGGLAYGAYWGYTNVMHRMAQSSATTAEASSSTSAEAIPPKATANRLPTIPFKQESLDKPLYILLLGVDRANNNTLTSVFLTAVNVSQKVVDVIGIPGNTKIDARDKKSVEPLQNMYRDGKFDLTKAVVEDMFHINIPYVIVVDQNAFTSSMDIMGNIRMYVERSMQVDGTNGQDISLSQGFQQLNGAQSWAYFSYENNSENGVEKTQRQERLMKTVINKELSRWTLMKIFSTYRYWDTLETNISTLDAMKFVFASSQWDASHYHFYVLPGAIESINGVRYWLADPIEAQRLVGITMNAEGMREEGQTIVTPNKKAKTTDTPTNVNNTDTKSNTQKNN